MKPIQLQPRIGYLITDARRAHLDAMARQSWEARNRRMDRVATVAAIMVVLLALWAIVGWPV